MDDRAAVADQGDYWAPGPAAGTAWLADGRCVAMPGGSERAEAVRAKAIERAEEVLAELRNGAEVEFYAGAYAQGVVRAWRATIPEGQPWEGRPCGVTRRVPFDPREPIVERSARILTDAEVADIATRHRPR